MPQQHILVVYTEPVAGREDEFNKWYDDTHLAEVMAVPGFVDARRYLLSDAQPDEEDDRPHTYLALYTMEGDPAAALKALADAAEDGSIQMSDALDEEKTKAWSYTPMQ